MTPQIVIIDTDADRAQSLAAELAFLDEPHVRTGTLDDWQRLCAAEPVLALFVGPGIGQADVPAMLDEVADWNRDLPVVLVGRDANAA